jgi:hypothetical protein
MKASTFKIIRTVILIPAYICFPIVFCVAIAMADSWQEAKESIKLIYGLRG